MMPRQQVSRAALELIKSFEGFRETAAQLPDGRWTIGHGHTKTARRGVRVTQEDARDLLIYDLIEVTKALNASVFTPLTQNQFDALAAFVFNIGPDSFRGSAVLRRINEGELLMAAYAMELWRKAEFEGEVIVVDALVRRRAVEKTLFLTPPGGFVAAPTPLLAPRLDEEARDHAPAETPAEIVATTEGDQVTAQRAQPPLIPQPVEDVGPSLADLVREPAAEAAPAPAQAAPAAQDLASAPEEEAPSLAELRAPEPVAYDGAPVAAPALDDEAPLPPSPESVEAQAEAAAEPVVQELATAPAAADSDHPPVHPPRVATFDATTPELPGRKRALVFAVVLGLIGVGAFGMGLVAVYRGKYENSGSVTVAFIVSVVGLLCLAAMTYILLDRPEHED